MIKTSSAYPNAPGQWKTANVHLTTLPIDFWKAQTALQSRIARNDRIYGPHAMGGVLMDFPWFQKPGRHLPILAAIGLALKKPG